MSRKIHFRYFDKPLLLIPVVIFLIGILSIYSASYKLNQTLDDMLAIRQILWMGVGVLLVFLVVRADYFRLMDWAWPLYFFTVFLLFLVLFTPARLGAHRWFRLGPFNFQPSELAKLSVIFVLSRFFANNKPEFISKSRLLVPFAVVAVPCLLILKEPDLGTGLLLIPVFLAMLYFWGMNPKMILALIGLGLLISPFLAVFLKEYQRARLLVFVNPNLDPLGAGYTIIQSKIAIGSGGIFGKGFMGGTQNVLKFLPERHTDFIFGVVGEEGGFIASAAVLLLFWLIVKKGFIICSQTTDRFGSHLACGISTLLGLQVIINVGMTMGVFPVVGVPLPLVSYGGSSVIVTMLAIGLLISIKMHRSLL